MNAKCRRMQNARKRDIGSSFQLAVPRFVVEFLDEVG